MGEAREVMDRVTEAVLNGDSEALKALYAPDAVAETPDQGTITGRDQIAAYLGEFSAAFPDASWEDLYKHETGETAIDEGYFVGTNTGRMTGPNGDTIRRPANVCALASATSRRSRTGFSRATGSTSTCSIGSRSSVSRPSRRRSPRPRRGAGESTSVRGHGAPTNTEFTVLASAGRVGALAGRPTRERDTARPRSWSWRSASR